MNYSTKRRVVLGMTTGGLLMTGLGMANAHADTTATGSTTHSPGIGSGNLLQLPVNAPINVCGNQLDVIAILDSVTGNSCENGSAPSGTGGSTSASGTAKNSPGAGSGNLIQVPVNAPINVCGNQVDVVGIGDSDHGNSCENGGGGSTTASGRSSGSPGIGAGNLIQVPINAPVNVCGNQVDVVGILNSVFSNSCANNDHGRPPQPSPSPTPTPVPTQPSPTPTGTGCDCPPTPPPPPPSTPCPPSGTRTPTPISGSSSPTGAPTPSPSTRSGGSNGGGSNGGGSHGGVSGSNGGSSGTPSGVLAHTGSAALAVAPVGAGLIGGGMLLRKRFFNRLH
jgi:ChpA-C